MHESLLTLRQTVKHLFISLFFFKNARPLKLDEMPRSSPIRQLYPSSEATHIGLGDPPQTGKNRKPPTVRQCFKYFFEMFHDIGSFGRMSLYHRTSTLNGC